MIWKQLVVYTLFCGLSAYDFQDTNKITQWNFVDSRQAQLAESLDQYEIIHPRKVDHNGAFISHTLHHTIQKRDTSFQESHDQDKLHYKLHIEGEEMFLKMKANHRLFAPGLVVERRRRSFGNISDYDIKKFKNERCHFVGDIGGYSKSQVALTTCSGLTGLLHTHKGDYFIEPVKGHKVEPGQGQPHLIYKRSALPPETHIFHDHPTEEKKRKDGTCGVKETYEKAERQRERWESHRKYRHTSTHKSHHRHKRSISMERNVETLVVVDQTMIKFYEDEDIETYILTIMNMVSTLYYDASIGNAVNIVLVRLIFLEGEEKDLLINHHADHTLKSFCKWQQAMNPKDDKHPNHHDVAILITRYDICSRMNEPCSTLGLAQVSGMCQPHRSCSVNEDTGLALAYTLAHEVGHNFGMQHDDPNGPCRMEPDGPKYVMAAQLSADAHPMIWSNCSREAITKFLDRDWGYCLEDEPEDHDFNFPVLPPGVMYDIDHQCRLQHGPGAKYCDGIDNICSTLWCQLNNKCRTMREAAAVGTLCGDSKWCFGGACVEIGERPEAIYGEWGEWGQWHECSRTCGAGVSYAERLCNNPPPKNGGKYCLGERKRFRICNTEDCPPDKPNFRQAQCEEFNYIPYKNGFYKWEWVPTPVTPCQLHCKPTNKFFSVMLKDIVTDGTPCRPGRKDLCISGKCMSVGCDWVIDSKAVEDRCGICHGDGTTCTTVQQEFKENHEMGYVEASIIPEGARNIRVEEVAEANNYIAIMNDRGEYLLNGGWYIQWSGDYNAGGTVVHYEREGNKESIHATGPLAEPLHVMLLFQSQNPGLKFEYTVPMENATVGRKQIFEWKYLGWSHCTSSCGGGIQTSKVVCTELEAGQIEDHYCNETTRPDDKARSCNKHLCPARWWAGPWQHCTTSCGDKGLRRRTVLCVRNLGPDEQIALNDNECEDYNKPTSLQPCKHKEPCPEAPAWLTGDWSGSCGIDPCEVQYRQVSCSEQNRTCDESEKPVSERVCREDQCGQWQYGEWTRCTRTCDGGLRFRSVSCVNGIHCPKDKEPPSEEECNTQSCFHISASSSKHYDNDVENYYNYNENSVDIEEDDSEAIVDNHLNNVNIENEENENEWNTPDIQGDKLDKIHVSDTEKTVENRNDIKITEMKDTHENMNDIKSHEQPSLKELFTEEDTKTSNHKSIKTKLSEEISLDSSEKTSNLININQMENSFKHLEEPTLTPSGGGNENLLPSIEVNYEQDPWIQWHTSEWTECSRTCGGGFQQRKVICPEMGSCDPETMPSRLQICNENPCIHWIAGPWSQCTESCNGGTRMRMVACLNLTSSQPTTGCEEPKPTSEETCNTKACPTLSPAAAQESVTCEKDELSYSVCRSLRKIGRCSLLFVQKRCCRTCHIKDRDSDDTKDKLPLGES